MRIATRLGLGAALLVHVGVGRQLGELRVVATILAGDLLTRDPLDVTQQRTLVLGAERDGRAILARARRAADAVDILLGNIRQLELDHMRH